jgi:hypothetical protein
VHEQDLKTLGLQKIVFGQSDFLKLACQKILDQTKSPNNFSEKQIFVWTTSPRINNKKYFILVPMSLHQIAHVDEILDRIFVHLDTPTLVRKIQLVNKQWFNVAEEHVDYSYSNNLAIRRASELGNLQLVKKLLQNPKVNPRACDNYAIRLASTNGHLTVVNMLLGDPRVDPTSDKQHAIRWASRNGHIAVVNRLLKHPKVNPAASNNSAIR